MGSVKTLAIFTYGLAASLYLDEILIGDGWRTARVQCGVLL
jgi:hypothetical protein